MPVWTFRGLCVAGGAVGMFLIAGPAAHRLLPPPLTGGRLVVTALFNVTLWNLCIAYGLTYLPVGRSVILAYTMPLWVVLLSRLFLERAPHASPIDRRRARHGGDGAADRQRAGRAAGRAGRRGSDRRRGAVVGGRDRAGQALSRRDLPTTAFTAWQMLIGGVPIAIGALAARGGALAPDALAGNLCRLLQHRRRLRLLLLGLVQDRQPHLPPACPRSAR